MKRFLYKTLIILGVVLVSSCDMDLLDNPNAVTQKSADPDLLLTNIQTSFATFFRGVSSRGGRVTRMYHQASDTYEISYAAVFQDGTWGTAYSNILNDIKVVKTIAAEKKFRRHLGIAKTLEAYIWMTLVDQFGNVPFTEALDATNFNPKHTEGAVIYGEALKLLTSAREDFNAIETIGTPPDLYFGRNYTRWIRLVNTLELKYHLNRRLIDPTGAAAGITRLVNEGNLLAAADNFVFTYGKNVSNPDTRHPSWAGQYPSGGGDYQSVYYMWHLTEAKGFTDPRAHYYFYRQRGTNTTSPSEARCVTAFKPLHYAPDMVWCMPGTRGYWGRDHLNNEGIPPDGLGRTLWGLYPAGGTFDNNTPVATSPANIGNGGAGIEPIMLASYVDFMRAEAALTMTGVPGVAKDLLISGITKHIDYVRSWGLTTAEASKISAFMPAADHTTRLTQYTTRVAQDFDATGANRMRVIAREYWIALFGNGVEAYNLYKRTGQPDGMQPGQVPSWGKFPRTFLYPATHVERNANVTQKANHDVRTFWDNNPAGFIN